MHAIFILFLDHVYQYLSQVCKKIQLSIIYIYKDIGALVRVLKSSTQYAHGHSNTSFWMLIYTQKYRL